jgi:hypothetical protein
MIGTDIELTISAFEPYTQSMSAKDGETYQKKEAKPQCERHSEPLCDQEFRELRHATF